MGHSASWASLFPFLHEQRDRFMSAEEAKQYGIIDHVLAPGAILEVGAKS